MVQDDPHAPLSVDTLTVEIGAIVHDFRNVLSAVRGFATVIGEELHPGDQKRDDVEQILKAVERGSELSDRLAALRARTAAALTPPAVTPASEVPSPAAAELERSTAWALQRPRRSAIVLVVEDDELVRTMAVRVLGRSGYTTLHAANAAEAEERARAHGVAVDLLLVDVGLPDSGGPDLAGRLQQRWPTVKVLFMSGFGRTALAERGVSLGPWFLEKPFAPLALLERIEALLAPGPS